MGSTLRLPCYILLYAGSTDHRINCQSSNVGTSTYPYALLVGQRETDSERCSTCILQPLGMLKSSSSCADDKLDGKNIADMARSAVSRDHLATIFFQGVQSGGVADLWMDEK